MSLHLTRAVLALDPGGSKCDAVLTGEDGSVVGWGRVQKPGLSGRSEKAIKAATDTAIGQCTFDELHVTGFGGTLPSGIIGPGRLMKVRFWPISEHDGVLALMGLRCGVVVVAGTGGRLSATTRDGRHVSLDGLGPLLGDYGSGYAIGLQGLRAAALAFMHPRHHTSLKLPILAEFDRVMSGREDKGAEQEESARELNLLQHAIWFSINPHDRSMVATLAKIVNEEAECGDAVAIRILKAAAEELSERIRDLLDRLQIANEEYVLAGAGSVAKNSDIFWNHLCNLVGEMAPRFKPVRSSGAAVLGNAAFVLRELNPELEESILKKLLATPPPPISSP